jgi:WD40 repeat protein
VYEVESGRLRLVAEHGEEMTRALFSPNGRLLLTVGEDHTAQLWDVEAGQRMATPPLQHEDTIRDVSFSPDGQLLATVSGDVTQLWTVATGEVSGSPLTPNSESAAFSPDGTLIATTRYTGVEVWDVRSRELKYPQLEHDLARMVAFSADDRFLVTASDGEARVWFVETGAWKFADTPLTHARMRVAKFSKDGSLIITASGHSNRQGYGHPRTDNEMRFWDADTGRRRLVKGLRHDHELMTLVFGPGSGTAVVRMMVGSSQEARLP